MRCDRGHHYPSLEQNVWFPTREDNTLNLVLTDVSEYIERGDSVCKPAPPICNNDHSSILLELIPVQHWKRNAEKHDKIEADK